MNRKIRLLLILALLFPACGILTPSQVPTVQSIAIQDTPVPVSPAETAALTLAPTTQPTVETSTTLKPTAVQTGVIPVTGVHFFLPISSQEISLVKDTGAYWTRTDGFHWNQIQPTNSSPAVYDWSSVNDQMLQETSASGLQLIASIIYTPGWAQKNPGALCGAVAQDSLSKFVDFMGALVSRYSQPPYNIKYWEIGNEPDIDPSLVPPDSGFGCWGDKTDPYYGGGYYAEVLKAVYPRLKAADPQSQLMVGGLLLDCDPVKPPEIPAGSGNFKDCTPSKFLEGILKNGGSSYFDGVSIHSYDYYGGSLGKYGNPNWHSSSDNGGPSLVSKAGYVSSLLAAYGAADKYLLGTELALLCGRDGTEDICRTSEFETTKAAYLVQAMIDAQVSHFRGMTWYGLVGWRGSGLATDDLQPLPAYYALKFFNFLLSEAVNKQPVTDCTGVVGYEFAKGDQSIWVLWSGDGISHNVTLAALPKQIYNLSGEIMPVQLNVEVGPAPIYVVW